MNQSMISGKPVKLILMFSLPMLIGNLFQNLYVMADTMIISQVLGPDTLAAIGSTGTFSYWVSGIVTGFVTGLCVIVSQYFGAQDEEGVKRSFAASIILSVLTAVFVTVVSVALSEPILIALETPDEIRGIALKYLYVTFGGISSSVVFHLAAGLVRALGDSRRALYFTAFFFVLAALLDYVFVCLLGMDVAGIALSGVVSQLIAGLCCFVYIKKKVPQFRIEKKHFLQAKKEFGSCLRISLPIACQTPIIGVGLLALQYAINTLGTDALAAYTAASRVENFSETIFISFGATMSTYVAQNYGAGRIDRIRKGVFQCLLISFATSGVFLLIHTFAGRALIHFMVGEVSADVMKMAHSYLVIMGIANVFLAMIYILKNALQGLGHTTMPVASGFVESAMRIFVAMVLVGMLGFGGVQLGHPLAWTGAGLTLLAAYCWIMHRRFGKRNTL